MDIQITGLNRKQKMLADIIWALDSQEQVLNFIASLPPKDRKEAETVTQLMILAFFDEVTDTQEACQVIDQFRLTGA
jgi:hypothetical protein